jgi:hypothetical protein
MNQDEMSKFHRGPSINASYQVSVYLAMQFQRISFFRNRPIRNKNCLWWPCLLMNRAIMSTLYREPSIDASYQVSVHLAKRFQRRGFLEINQSETRIACGAMFVNESSHNENFFYRGPTIDASYQVSVHLVKWFQRRRNGPIRNKNCLWGPCLLTDRDEMSNLYRGPSIDASYQVLVHLVKRFQRRRFLEIGQSETRIACGGHIC